MFTKIKKIFALGLALILSSCFFCSGKIKAFKIKYFDILVPINHEGKMGFIANNEIFYSNDLLEAVSMLPTASEATNVYKWKEATKELLNRVRNANIQIYSEAYEKHKLKVDWFYNLIEDAVVSSSVELMRKLSIIIKKLYIPEYFYGLPEYKSFMTRLSFMTNPDNKINYQKCVELANDTIRLFCLLVIVY